MVKGDCRSCGLSFSSMVGRNKGPDFEQTDVFTGVITGMQLHLCRYRGFFAQGQAYQDFAGRAVPAAVGGLGSRLGIWGGGKRDPRFSKGLSAPNGYPRLARRRRRFHKTKSIDTNCQIAFQALGTDWLPWGRAL